MPTTVNRDTLVRVSGVRCPTASTVVLWILGGAIMIGLTVKDIRPLLIDYFNDEENTQVQIKPRRSDDRDAGFERPDVFVTIPLGSMANESLDPDLFTNLSSRDSPHSPHKMDTITNGSDCPQCRLITMLANNNRSVSDRWSLLNLSDPKSPRNFLPFVPLLLRSNVVPFIFDESLNESQFRLHNLSWNRPVIYSLISYLCSRSVQERSRILSPMGKFVELDMLKGFDNISWIENIDLDQMYAKLTSYVWSYIQFYNGTKLIDYRPSIDLFRNTTVAFVQSEGLLLMQRALSLRLPLNDTTLFQMMVSSHYFDSDFDKRRVQFRVYTENPTHGDPWECLYATSQEDLREDRRQLSVNIIYSPQYNLIETRPHKLRTCYEESSKIDCEWNCRMRALESLCGCRSYLDRRSSSMEMRQARSNSSLPYCSRTDFDRCSHVYSNATVRDCSTKCNEPCRSISYEWQIKTSLELENDTDYCAFNLRVAHQPRSYLEFVMSVKDSPENLISQVGGVLNFYLGVSGLSIIFFLIYLFDCWRRWRRLRRSEAGRRSQDESKNGTASSLGDWFWKWRWMRAIESASTVDEDSSTNVSVQISALIRRLEAMEENNHKMHKKIDVKLEEMGRVIMEVQRKLAGMGH